MSVKTREKTTQKNSRKTCNFEHNKLYLKRYIRIMKKIERLQTRLNDLSDAKSRDETESLIMDETKYRIDELTKQSKAIRLEIYDALDQLENYNEVEILEMFFIFGYDFDAIADEMSYSVRHVIRAYSSGIRKLHVTNMSV